MIKAMAVGDKSGKGREQLSNLVKKVSYTQCITRIFNLYRFDRANYRWMS